MNVIGVIREPFARENLDSVNNEHKSDSVNSAFSLRTQPVNERPKTCRNSM